MKISNFKFLMIFMASVALSHLLITSLASFVLWCNIVTLSPANYEQGFRVIYLLVISILSITLTSIFEKELKL